LWQRLRTSAQEALVLKISLALAAALIAGSAFVTTAEAGGCHHGFGGGFLRHAFARQSFADNQERLYEKRRAIARARAETKARQLAAQRAVASKIDVAKVETAPAKVADATKKGNLATPGTAVVAAATPVCRKFSAAVGGLVETACE
jgi:hypothetical protein